MINDLNLESQNKKRQSFMIIRTIFCKCVTREGRGGRTPLPIFGNMKKNALIFGKTLNVVIYGLNLLFKVQFLRISKRKN